MRFISLSYFHKHLVSFYTKPFTIAQKPLPLRIKQLICVLAFTTMPAICHAQSAMANEEDGIEHTEHSFNTNITAAQIQAALKDFYTPGMAVGVVYQGETLFLDGFGRATLKNKTKVTKETYFRLASTSKAFTAAGLAILVDEGKLNWRDRVIDHLPNFQMQDAWVTREFTIEDLLTHRSGLVSGAGDSMIWPEPSGFTRQEVIERLKFLSPDSSFRSQYAYSNVLYITAGEVIAKVSGKSYAEFLDEKLFRPLDMTCFAGDVPQSAISISATPYGHNDARGLYPIPRNAIGPNAQMSVAAGGIVCNAESMTKWLTALLEPASLPFSSSRLNDMWRSRTILGVASFEEDWDGKHFKTYGYGWRISNIREHKVISHTGTLSGYQAYVALIPKLDLGVVILNNGSNYGARSAVMQHILKSFLVNNDSELDDWVQVFIDFQAEQEEKYLANKAQDPVASLPMQLNNTQVLGTYTDQWFGDIVIEEIDGKLRVSSARMVTLQGELTPFEANKYKATWDNQNAASDAFLLFEVNLANKVTGMTMHPFATKERSRHAYRDMHFKKQ